MKRDFLKKIISLLLIFSLVVTLDGLNIYASQISEDTISSEVTQTSDTVNQDNTNSEQSQFTTQDDSGNDINIDTGFDGSAATERATSALELGYEPGEILVVYKSSINDSKIEDCANNLDGEVETVIPGSKEDVAVVEIADDTTVEEACAEYNELNAISYAQPNYILSIADSTVNDPYYSAKQWYLSTDNGYNSRGINAVGAWNLLSQYSSHSKVRVGVIDSGCETDHPDLTNILNKNLSKEITDANSNGSSYSTKALLGDSCNSEDLKNKQCREYSDSKGHGTHVCGLIAAQSNNNKGIAGAASGLDNSIVDLVAIDGLNYGSNGSTSYVIAALNYAKKIGCKVINMSLGVEADSKNVNDNQAMQSKCNELYNGGITIVCAAGNSDSSNEYYPACYSSTIAVINTCQNGSRNGSSNYGSWCDICAPGTELYSTVPKNSYSSKTGTSMASPLVAATAAMILSVNKYLRPSEVQNIITSTATDLGQTGKDDKYANGLINARACVQEAKEIFDANAVQISFVSNTTTTINSQYIYPGYTVNKPTDPVKTGYTFKGWFTDTSYKTQWNFSSDLVGQTNMTLYAKFVEVTVEPTTQYRTHIQNIGWETTYKTNGQTSGTSGQSKRLEAIQIKLNSQYSGSILYRTHIQNIGWESSFSSNGATSGTSGRSLRLEAIQIKLSGEIAEQYDVYYRVHAQNFGWMGWAKNGASAGTAGYSYRLEAIQIKLVKKGSAAPGDTNYCYKQKGSPYSLGLSYTTHVQNVGWQDYVKAGTSAGTTSRSLRLEAIKIKLNSGYTGGIMYNTHIQNIGWQASTSNTSKWKKDGTLSGTSGRSLRLEAIQIKLYGVLDTKYDVYYRVHAQNVGWMGWAHDGQCAGTAGYSYRLEGIQIVLVPNGGDSPGTTSGYYKSK